MKTKILQILTLFCCVFTTHAEINIDKQRPDNVGDQIWSGLKTAIQESKLLPTPEGIGGEGSRFGASVSIDGNRALIGGYQMAGSGVVYVMDYDGNNWNETTILIPADGETDDKFGYSVSLSGNRAAIGAHTDDNAELNTGSVYIYDYDGNSWILNQKVIAAGLTADDNFGYSVSLSGDRVLIGAPYDDNNGSAYVYDYDGTNWLLNQKLNAFGGLFGFSVSLQGDRALVGASQDKNGGLSTGSAFVYDYDGSMWSLNQKIFANDAATSDSFGSSVSLSGNRVVIGAQNDDDNGSNSGSAYIYDYDGTDWLLNKKIIANDIVAGDGFGNSVSLIGNRLMIGAPNRNGANLRSGAAYIFDYDGSDWLLNKKLFPNDGLAYDEFGSSVSLSSSTDRILIGARYDDNASPDSGSAYIFDYDNVDWSLNQKLIGADGAAGINFGISVSLSGQRALIGAFGGEGGPKQGAAYIYDYNGMNWSLTQKLIEASGVDYNNFGVVSLSGDRALIGAPGDEDDLGFSTGSAYVYDFDGNSWIMKQKLLAPDGANYDYFGSSVSLSGDRVVIGAPYDNESGAASGSAYVYDYDGNSWVFKQKLVASDGAYQDKFGFSVSLSDNRVLIGAPDDDDAGSSSGSAYIYDYDGSSWSLNDKLVANDGAMTDKFGYSVSLLGNRVLIGANGDKDEIDSYQLGSAYIYDYVAGNWLLKQKLVADDSIDRGNFGHSVSLSTDKALIGAYQNNGLDTNSGSAYVYDFDGNDWVLDQKLLAEDGATGDQFGRSVSLSGDRVLIGSPKDNGLATKSGAAYVINVADTFEVSVDVSGLASGNSIELLNNGGDNLFVGIDGIATFSNVLYNGDEYNVTVQLPQPTDPNQTCVVSNPIGNINDSNVQLDVICSTNKYNIAVTVTGLDANNSIELTTNGQNLLFNTNTTSNFPNPLDDGTAYAVLLTANPTAPNQTCTVTGGSGFLNNGSGTIFGGPVAIDVLCITEHYSIGGMVSGLASDNQVILQNNSGDNLTVSTNTSFTFDTLLDDESDYAVTVLTDPTTPNQTCTVTGGDDSDGSGQLSGNHEAGIVVTCITNQYDININIAGLAASNTVSFINGIDELVIATNGVFTLSTLNDESHFNVSITNQPETPNQICSFEATNEGDLAGDDVQLNINCVTNSYYIGGEVTGLLDGNYLVLQNNNGNDKIISTNGSYVFSTPLLDQQSYDVSIDLQPNSPIQLCSVANGQSDLAGDDVIDVNINCLISNDLIYRHGFEAEAPNQ